VAPAAAPAPEAISPEASELSPTVAGPAAIPSEVPASVCTPSCRRGFTCIEGRCVSSCNPPCGIGELCSEQGECLIRAQEPLGPVYLLPDPGTHRHDGFFLRLTLGLGGGAVVLDAPDTAEETYSGAGWVTSVDVGGSPFDNFVIFGRLRDASLVDPQLEVGGDEIGDADGVTVSQVMLGAGVSYYFMPLNFYIGGAIGFAGIEAVVEERGRDDVRSNGKVGAGLDLDIGKEWWVSANWGLGVAARLSVASVPGGDDLPKDATFGAALLSVQFSATYQ
jgi:hypothetical protein